MSISLTRARIVLSMALFALVLAASPGVSKAGPAECAMAVAERAAALVAQQEACSVPDPQHSGVCQLYTARLEEATAAWLDACPVN